MLLGGYVPGDMGGSTTLRYEIVNVRPNADFPDQEGVINQAQPLKDNTNGDLPCETIKCIG